MLSLVQALTILILFQLGLLIAFLLSSKRGRRISNLLLAAFFFLLFINLLDGFLSYTGFYTTNPNLAHWEDGFVFLLGPVLYLYTNSLIYKGFGIDIKHLKHVIPFIVFTAGYQLFYHLQPTEYQNKVQAAIFRRELPPGFYLSIVLVYSHVIIYIGVALRNLQRYRYRLREEFSTLERINLNWLAFMLASVLVILLVSLAATFVPITGVSSIFKPLVLFSFIILFGFVLSIVWRGLRQPEIFAGIDMVEPDSVKKYALAFDPLEIESIKSRLSRLMEIDKVYLNPDISLDELAQKLELSPKKVSQVINDSFNQNFFDFINSYRIREAERIFSENKDRKLTVLEVMYACGFNSKSSFNTIFKQKTGITPSAYKAKSFQ